MTDINAILAKRQKTHGSFKDQARTTQSIKNVMWAQPGWDKLTDTQRESLEMNAHKIGRILAGNPATKDHWDDIAGYAQLISKELK